MTPNPLPHGVSVKSIAIVWIIAAALCLPTATFGQEETLLSEREATHPGSRPRSPEVQPGETGRFVIAPDHLGRMAFDPALAGALQRTLDSVRTVQGTRGMSAAVLIPGQGLWQGVSGVSSRTPLVNVEPAMLFGIGSNTKAFVSTTVLSLVDSARLSLDDPLSRWLPSYPNVTPSVTIRQLLNMTSGLFDYLNDSNAQGDSVAANPTRLWSPEELIRTFVGPVRSAPGGAYRYCNTNYVLLGMVVNSVTGRSVSSEIRKRILAPLSLDHTFLEVEEPYTDPVAHPWDGGVDFAATPVTAHFSTLWTAGGIMSTAENLARWVKGLYEGAAISKASLEAMLTVVPMSSNAAPGLDWTGYGLGVRRGGYLGKPLLGHGGAIMGYISHTGYLPRHGTSFAVLTNMSEANATKAMTALMDAYLRWIPANPPVPGSWYTISGKSDSTRLHRVDRETGVLTPIGPMQYGTFVGARVHPRTGIFWALTNASGWELAQIDASTGEAFPRVRVTFPAGAPTDLRGLDFAPDGSLYVGSVDGRIYAVDLTSGSAVLAASTKLPISGLAFEPSTGALWASPRTSPVTRDRIYRITLPGGDTVGVGNTGFTQILADIAFETGGDLYGLAGNPSTLVNYRWAKIDKTTGAGSEIGSVGFYGMVGIAYAPPSTDVRRKFPDLAQLPAGIELRQNYPNPFNASSVISYQISGSGTVRLAVYDLLGREVAVLVDGTKEPGSYQVTVDASQLASGVYVYRLVAGAAVLARKLILTR
jgi:D-alanyl-D-alanine carboxypeptidase